MKSFLIVLALTLGTINANAQIKEWKIGDVDQFIKNAPTDVVIINFWATFCKPCVAEIPFFIRNAKAYGENKVTLVLVSLDLPNQFPKKIETFAKQHNFNATIVWLNETNADYFCPKIDSTWSGSIPATLMINKRTGERLFYEEEMSETDFKKRLEVVSGKL